MRERHGANERSQMLKHHLQTSGRKHDGSLPWVGMNTFLGKGHGGEPPQAWLRAGRSGEGLGADFVALRMALEPALPSKRTQPQHPDSGHEAVSVNPPRTLR